MLKLHNGNMIDDQLQGASMLGPTSSWIHCGEGTTWTSADGTGGWGQGGQFKPGLIKAGQKNFGYFDYIVMDSTSFWKLGIIVQ